MRGFRVWVGASMRVLGGCCARLPKRQRPMQRRPAVTSLRRVTALFLAFQKILVTDNSGLANFRCHPDLSQPVPAVVDRRSRTIWSSADLQRRPAVRLPSSGSCRLCAGKAVLQLRIVIVSARGYTRVTATWLQRLKTVTPLLAPWRLHC